MLLLFLSNIIEVVRDYSLQLVQYIIYLKNKIHSGPVWGGNGATRKRNRRRRKRPNSDGCFGNRLGFGKMSKKAKKRRRRGLSSSSEEDEKESKKQDLTKNNKSSRGKPDLKNQERFETKPEKSAFPSVKDVPKSTRQIKKPVYRLAKTQEKDQEPVKKEEERTKQKHASPPDLGGKFSSKAKNDISRKDKTVSGSKTEEAGPSKHLNTSGAVPQGTEKTSKGSLDEKSSQGTPSKLKKHLMSPSLVCAEQKEQGKNELKKCRAKEPPRTENDCKTVKTKEPSNNSSVSKDSAWEQKIDVFKKMCQRHEENKAKKSMWIEVKTPSASTTTKSSTSAKPTTSTSVSNSKVVKKVTLGSQKPSSSQEQVYAAPPFVPFKFKIPKKVKPTPVESTVEKKEAKTTKKGLDPVPELPETAASSSKSEEKTVQQAPVSPDVTPSVSSEGQDEGPPLAEQLPNTFHTVPAPWYDQMQVVEELHLARSQKRLEVNVMQSYGDLTCMDIDPPEEGGADTHCKQPNQQYLILVLDTNILLSHLDYIKKIRMNGLGDLGFPIVLIPWVVLQELDSLKRGRGLSGSVAHLATPAISYIYNCLKSRAPFLWGQSMQQASESNNGLNAENNDDRVLQCCLQYQSLYPECAHILCTNDKNLCSKALLSGVKALCKIDLEAEVGRSKHGFHPPQNVGPQIPSAVQNRFYAPVQPRMQRTRLHTVEENDNKRGDERPAWDPSSVSELEQCLLEVLSDVLEVEMKAAFEDIWLDIVYIKPPWTLLDVLKCFKKHWIAVFGNIVPRRKQQTVLTLINFFNSGGTSHCRDASALLRDAKELVKAFGKRSRRVFGAISRMDNIFNKRQPQWESPAIDVVMNEEDEYHDDEEEAEQPTPAPFSHQEVWALFEHLWSYVFQMSWEVFKALGFDPNSTQSTQPGGGPAPPQDAVDCLHNLCCIVSQLLQIFSSVLSSAPRLEEVQTLLSILHSNKIVNLDSRLTAKDFLDCLVQQDNREKLSIGGNQLLGVKEVLDRCVGVTCQHINFNTSRA
ncbi:hypothetical protein NQZ68_004734 [Dissostichus eleginoides]|nr:hypothetical protein NQZ68_004734 [Dissostichus eleginoides]